MRAYQLEAFGFDGLVARNLRDPDPGPGQVLVELKAASLNYRDLLVIQGLYDPRMALPITPLSDGAGVVVAIGEGVTQRKVGDRVVGAFMQTWIDGPTSREKTRVSLGGPGPGMLATHVLLSEEGVVSIPERFTFEEAAALPCAGVTAWHALFEGRQLKPGDTVLVQGTGGVSIFALQFATAAGARVIVTSGSDAKLERAKSLGAWETINYKTTPEWGARARILAAGGVDCVIEVGGSGTIKQSVGALRYGGRVELIGVLAGASGDFPLTLVQHKGIQVRGIYVGSVAMFNTMIKAMDAKNLRPVVGAEFSFDSATDGFHYMESGSHFGKVVITI